MKKNILIISLFFFSLSFAQPQDSFYGVQTHFGQIYRPDVDSLTVLRTLDSIKSAGIKFIRDECYWSIIETTPGIFAFDPKFDFYIAQAKLRGIDVLLILDYNNPLYAAHAGAAVTTDTNRTLFARYCMQVVSRYLPLGVKHYEIWNEPNIPMFWDPTPNANDYTLLLKKVYPVIKQIDSTITVVACATSPSEGNPSPYISWLTYIQQVFSAGGGNYMDGISFHLYRLDKIAENHLQMDINDLISITGANKSFWITEIGYPTTNATTAKLLYQAEYVTRLYLLGRSIPQLKRISYYDFKNDGENQADPEQNFGLVKWNFEPKPAYIYYKTMTKEIGKKKYISSSTGSSFYKFVFSDTLSKTLVFWHTTSMQQKHEQFESSILKITLSTGDTYYVYDKDKSMLVGYTTSPKYYTELTSIPPIQQLYITPTVDSVLIGQSITLSLYADLTNGKHLFIDSTAATWSLQDTTGTIDTLGVFKAKSSGLCRVKAEFNGFTVIKIFHIFPSFNMLEIEPFNSLNNFAYSFYNLYSSATTLTIIDSNYTTQPKSLQLNYKFKYIASDKHRVYFDCGYSLLGEPDSIELDVYGNGNNHIIGFQFEDADGQLFTVNTNPSSLSGPVGWRTTRATLKSFGSSFNYPAKLKRIIFYCVKNNGIVDSVYSGSVLLDNLRIHNGMPVDVKQETTQLPKIFQLFQNYPNPFNPHTVIRYTVGLNNENRMMNNTCWVTLKIYDVLGKERTTLVNAEKTPGTYEVEFNASDLPTGVYFYTLQSGKFYDAKKTLLIK